MKIEPLEKVYNMTKLDFQNLIQEAFSQIKKAENQKELFEIEKKYLGRKGEISLIFKNLKNFPEKERKEIGRLTNQARQQIEGKIRQSIATIQQTIDSSLKEKFFDPTLPGKKPEIGHLHPLTLVKRKVEEIFQKMEFEILEGPEIEIDYYNFESLNIPKDHPARDMWDTFYLNSKTKNPRTKNPEPKNLEPNNLLLRTHTSSMQVRIMEKRKPPLKILIPGRCFRHEATDASHEHTFYQIDAFAVDKKNTLANLIATLNFFLEKIFEKKVNTRFRPGYFPFVEPGLELDLQCFFCKGQGCNFCKQTGWIEILGCGMIHPKIFEFAGYPKNKYTGFAFGFGLDRLMMMLYGVNDIRLSYSGDLRFLNQF